MKKAIIMVLFILCSISLFALSPEDAGTIDQVKATSYGKFEPLYPTFSRFGLDMTSIPAKCPVSMSLLSTVINSYRDYLSGNGIKPNSEQIISTIGVYKELDAASMDKLKQATSYIETTIQAFLDEKVATEREEAMKSAKIADEQRKINETRYEKEQAAIQEKERADAEREQKAAAAIEAKEVSRRDALMHKYKAVRWIYCHTDLLNESDLNEYIGYLVISNPDDTSWHVISIVDKYIIYMNRFDQKFALIGEKGKAYPSDSRLALSVCYEVVGFQRFTNLFKVQSDLLVIRALGPQDGAAHPREDIIR